MEELILNELVTIKELLAGILMCLVVFTLAFITFISLSAKRVKNQLEANRKHNFIIEAERHENVGDFSSLQSLAEERHKDYPYDLEALWYIAIAQYKQEHWGAALSSFKNIQNIDPAWRKYTVEDYIDEISPKLTGPTG